MKRWTVWMTFAAVLLVAANASALDAYQDRRGLFAGVSLGGGPGAADVENPTDITGLDENRQLGFHIGAELGGGVSKNVTAALGLNWWIRTVTVGSRHLNHQHLSLLPTARLFIIDGLYAVGGAGLGYAVFDAERAGVQVQKYREMGLAAKLGAGYEFFLNGTVAGGIEANYTRHFYANADFDTINGLVTVRWY